ncbi:MAG: MATE family efflux transporter, partial [Planctomycetes bacterium]|nr:MATE family efflux transporter [Planctomycetota bacterium]
MELAETKNIPAGEQLQVGRDVLRISIPYIIENVSRTVFFITDQIMLGYIGGKSAERALAAMSIAGPVTYTYQNLLHSFAVVTTAITARAYGEGKQDKINRAVSTIFFITLITGLLAVLIGLFLLARLPQLLAPLDDPLIGDTASLYLSVVMSCFIFDIFEGNFASILRACSNARTPMIFGVVANIINAILNYLLIFG